MAQTVPYVLAHNRDLGAGYVDLAKARGVILQAGLKPNPALHFTANLSPLAHRLQKARSAARLDSALALAEIRNRERLLIGQVQRLFAVIVTLKEQISLRDKLLEVSREFTTISSRRLRAAEVSEIDLNTIRIE